MWVPLSLHLLLSLTSLITISTRFCLRDTDTHIENRLKWPDRQVDEEEILPSRSSIPVSVARLVSYYFVTWLGPFPEPPSEDDFEKATKPNGDTVMM